MENVEEKWQTKCSSIRERTKYIFNTGLLSDVEFIFPVSNGESAKKVILAHKLVLAMGSPKFFDRFCGQTSDTEDSIEVPDYDYESVLEFFRFIYCDKVKLTRSNAMNVLYLAKEHSVPSLAEECAEFLRGNLDPTNVLAILPHAQKFGDKDLEDRCWKEIEKYTEKVVTSDEFVLAERSLLESLVKREKSNLNEVELFKAVNRWAEKKMEEEGIASHVNAKRRIIGEEILKRIRFPVMSQDEFDRFVVVTNILRGEEVEGMKDFYRSGISSLPYLQSRRIAVLTRACRFKNFKKPPDGTFEKGCWSYSGFPDSLIISVRRVNSGVDKAIYLKGVQHFGRHGARHFVSMKIEDTASKETLAVKLGAYYPSEKDLEDKYYGFEVLFDTPLILEPGKRYKISSTIGGPPSWYGIEGERIVNFEGIKLKIRATDSPDHNGTSERHGQFPVFLFSEHSR